MAGTFQTDRAIFGNPIWKKIIDFRLFFFLYGNAVYRGNQKYNNVEVKRGQFLRSYRKLAIDLEYIDQHGLKQYSLHAIKDSIERLIKDGRIQSKETSIGTLFTINNYNEYQSFTIEQGNTYGNSKGTAREQQGNNKKKDKKDNNTTIPEATSAAVCDKNPVNWDNCRTDLQRLIAHYVRVEMPELYAKATQAQATGIFKRYGTAASEILTVAGDVETAKKAFDYGRKTFNEQDLSWNLSTIAKNVAEFVNSIIGKNGGSNVSR